MPPTAWFGRAWHYISIALGIHPQSWSRPRVCGHQRWDDMGWLLTPLIGFPTSKHFESFWWILLRRSWRDPFPAWPWSPTLVSPIHPTWQSEISDMLVTSDKSPVMWWISQFCSTTPPVGCLVIWGAVPQREGHTRGATRRVWGKAVALCRILVFMCWFYELYSGMSKKLEFPEWSASQPTSWPEKLRIQYIYQACSNHL